MATLNDIISDVELKLNGGDITDDSPLEREQIKFWINQYLNALITNEINSKTVKGEMIPSIYFLRETCKVGTLEEAECGGDCADKIYIELDEEPLTLNKGWEIVSVETDQGDTIHKASPESMNLFKHLRFSKPSEDNLLYNRIGQKIYIEGMKEADIDFDEINVVYIPKQDVTTLALTDEVKVSDLVLPELVNIVTQQGKLMLYGTQADDAQDGVDYKDLQYHTAIKSQEQPTTDQ